VAAFKAWLVFLILVVNVVGELQRKRTLAASRGFLAAARLSCITCDRSLHVVTRTIKNVTHNLKYLKHFASSHVKRAFRRVCIVSSVTRCTL